MRSCPLLMFLLVFKGLSIVSCAPVDPTEESLSDEKTKQADNAQAENAHSDKFVSSGCSDFTIAPVKETKSDEIRVTEHVEKTDVTSKSDELVSTEVSTSSSITTLNANSRKEEENSTNTNIKVEDDIVDKNDTFSFFDSFGLVGLDHSSSTTETTSLNVTEVFFSLIDLDHSSSTTETTSLNVTEVTNKPVEGSTLPKQNEEEMKVSSSPVSESAELREEEDLDKIMSSSTVAAEISTTTKQFEEPKTSESNPEMTPIATTSAPESELSTQGDGNSTIREIAIILLPLEEREEMLADAPIETIDSLLDIGGDIFKAEEIRNPNPSPQSTTVAVNSSTDDTKMETVVFNAPKIPLKLKSSTKATATTAELKVTTPVVSSTSEKETTTTTTTTSTRFTSTTTIPSSPSPSTVTTTTSSVSEETQTSLTTTEDTVLNLKDMSDASEDTNTPESLTSLSVRSGSQQTDSSTTTTISPTIHDLTLIDDSRYISGNNTDMVSAVQFLHYHDKASSEQCYKLVNAHWNYATNLTEENKKKQLTQTLEYSQFHKEAWKNATAYAWKSFNDTLLRRWFKSLSVLGTAALSDDTLTEFNKLKAEMKNIYSTAKICGYKTTDRRRQACSLSLEPDLQRIMTRSRSYEELKHIWKSWRDSAGKPIRQKYLKFVEISNDAAHLNGFRDTGDMWRESYESVTFREDLAKLWEQLRPLYEHLHAYVRRRLITLYGNDRIKEDGPIPAHLFGNMWAQSWVSLMDICAPYPGKPSVDVTPTMETKNMTALEMFKISEEFFTSLGLKAMPDEFWKHSLIEKPKDREIICHASAWDFCNGKDYRIKQCTDITMEDLITVHHEMGHIQYFLQYARQPNVFREGANPGFHEAIGDVLALSVSTPKHLQSIGLLENVADDPEGDLNFLLRTALEKVSFLPSGYLIDLWRWGLFSGEIAPEQMNSKWWELRLKYQGICPPVKRTESDFDPGAKYHIPGNVPYIRYFVSFVIQFQFHKVLCDAAGHTGPLHKCDVYRSKEAGLILSQVMELGSSEHWSEAMKIMTGGATGKMDASPILEYFEPLLTYLIEQNRNETIGWKSPDPTICP